MKRFILVISLLASLSVIAKAAGVLTTVYLNPVSGVDSNSGNDPVYPVLSWDKAISLAASNATIYVTWGSVAITTNMTINGNQYGATNITVMPNSGYTGALFTIAGGATGTFSNITLKGTGATQVLLSINSGGTLTINNNLNIINGGQVSLDGNANAINLTAAPQPSMVYQILTTYLSAADEGRAIVNAGSIASPMQYFNLIEPMSTADVEYELELDATTIRLREFPVGGVYLDPLNGDDQHSGAKSNRPVKTLARAISLWHARNNIQAGKITDIFVLTRITMTANLTLDGGIKLTRFAGDTDRTTTNTDFLIVYTGLTLTIDDATINNGSITGTALNSDSNGTLILNNGATILSANTSNIISSSSTGNTTINAGSTITSTGTSGYCIYNSSTSNLTINGGTITTNGNVIYKNYGTLTITGGIITHNGSSYCINQSYGTIIINGGTIDTKGSNAIYATNSGSITINGGSITNTTTSTTTNTIYSASSNTLTITGGTINAGSSTAIYHISTSVVTINACNITSTNTSNGAIYVNYGLRLNGQNSIINGLIYMANADIENYPITITSSSVTQNYQVRIANNTRYAALVKSNPVIDLGIYLSNFTLDPKPDYLLTAYANKGEAIRNLVLYNPNGIYVNDYTGNDSYAGTSPATPLKTLQEARLKTTPTKTQIYICDSTLTITDTQNADKLSAIDTISSFMFRNSAFLIRVATGPSTTGNLTLGNAALYTASTYVSRYIQMEVNTLVTLNSGTEIMINDKYGIYQNGGTLVMKSGSKIKQNPTNGNGTSSNGYGIYQSGITANTTLESGTTIERIYYGVYMASANTLTIQDNVLIQNCYYAVLQNGGGVATIGRATIQNCQLTSYALYVTNGTMHLNGTILQNNGYRTLLLTGVNSVVNMTDGYIRNNGSTSTTYEGAVYIQSRGTFNFSGGYIGRNNNKTATNKAVYGEQIYITSGGLMNFTGGRVVGNLDERNAIYVHASSTTNITNGHLSISNAAVLDSGFIYCNSPFFAPIDLKNTLSPGKIFNINLGDNMAGCKVVDGSYDGSSVASSVNNFVLNPELTTLSLSQSGNDVIVGSSAIYLDGVNGNDANNGSSAALAVKTFFMARQRLQASAGNYIIVVGTANLNNANEIPNWDLSFNPNAVIQRGLGFTGYLVNIPNGKHLTLSDITIDGNKTVMNISVNALITTNSGASLTINNGTKIQNNYGYGVYANYGKFFMNGGEISNNNQYGIYAYYGARTDSLIITGGLITKNNTGIYFNYPTRYISITGGDIVENTGAGITGSYNYYSILKLGGTAKINRNTSTGIVFSLLDSLIIEGTAQINNNGSYGLQSSSCRNTLITGGEVKNNGSYGLNISSNTSAYAGTGYSFRLSNMEITGNASYGLNTSYHEIYSIKNANISDNGSYGITSSYGSDLSISESTINNNKGLGVSVSGFSNMSIKDIEIKNNTGNGLYSTNSSIALPGVFELENADIIQNNGYGLSLNNYISYDLSKNINIIENKNSGIYSNSLLPSSISGNVLIKGNKATNGGGIYVNSYGTLNISGITLEADTCTATGGGGIYVAATGNVVMSDVKIINCVNTYTSTTASYGGSAIYSLGNLSMTGGQITGCKAGYQASVFASGVSANVNLTGININKNTAQRGAAIVLYNGAKITLDRDTIINNTSSSLSYTSPVTGDIHITGGATGRLSIRDRCQITGDIFISSTQDSIYIDEALLTSPVGAFRLLANSTGTGINLVTKPGTVVVSPNSTTVSDASQFLSRFTLVNQNIGRGLDKGGTEEKHIIIVNQFFIDGTKPGGNGANPLTAFNSISQMVSSGALGTPFTTVWVSGPVTTTGNDILPLITTNNVNLRRYTGFSVAAQPFPSYDSVMFTINPGASLIINGGNSLANNFTLSGEGGSSFTDASILKNNGILKILGYTTLFFNPTGGNGSAIYQNGEFHLSGNIEFNMYSTNTVYLPKDKVIIIPATLKSTRTIGITVETSPENTHIPGRVIALGTTANIPVGIDSLFVNELAPPKLPIGRRENGSAAEIIFYLADRNVGTVPPIYTTLQDAFDASVSANNDEVRLYGNTAENVIIDKTLKFNSKGNTVLGTFILDSTSIVQLLDNLHADTLFIRATTFAKKSQLDRNGYNALITKAAYLDLLLPENPIVGDWYPINLPFKANVSDIRNTNDTTYTLGLLTDYAIAEFSGQRRASYGIGNLPSNPDNDWQYFTGAEMIQGTGYMVTTKGIQTLRFKASDLNLFTVTTAPMSYYTGLATNTNHGINYIAQPMGTNSVISSGITSGIIQVSASLSSDRIGAGSYMSVNMSSSPVIAPYTNYFYQTGAPGIVGYTKSNLTASVRSGKASSESEAATTSSETPLYYELRLYDDDPDRYDALFVAASEYASKDNYEIGRDVIKMGTIGNALQLWSYGFDVALCANEALLENGMAEIPLFINTPIRKEYKLHLRNVVNFNEQLWLCRNGNPIQNLTNYPDYTIEGAGGVINEYSLRFTTGTTGNKTVINSEIYVYTENKNIIIAGIHPEDEYLIYDALGRLLVREKANSDREKVYAGTGAYVVQVNGISYKTVVK